MTSPDHRGPFGDIYQVDAVGTTAGANADAPAPGTGKVNVCTNIQCSGDAACVVTISDGTNTLWRKRFAAAFTMSETFSTPIVGLENAALGLNISASTANCEANQQGYITQA